MDFENINDLLIKVRSNEPIAQDEWFRYIANIPYCDIFAMSLSKDDQLKVYYRLSDCFPAIQKAYLPYYSSIIEAIQSSLLKASNKIIEDLQWKMDILKKKSEYKQIERALNWICDDIYVKTGVSYSITVEQFQKAMEL